MKVSGIDDKKGLEAVYEAHQISKGYVSDVKKEHKKYKGIITETGKLFDAEKTRLLYRLSLNI